MSPTATPNHRTSWSSCSRRVSVWLVAGGAVESTIDSGGSGRGIKILGPKAGEVGGTEALGTTEETDRNGEDIGNSGNAGGGVASGEGETKSPDEARLVAALVVAEALVGVAVTGMAARNIRRVMAREAAAAGRVSLVMVGAAGEAATDPETTP
jgi:hypothetical protein